MKEHLSRIIIGFIFSLLLTLAAFFLVIKQLLFGWDLILVLVGLALIQLWVQIIFFVHLDQEKGPRWNLAVVLSTIATILILVAGSLVIMNNLNYRHMSPGEVDQYMLHQENFQK